MTSNNETENMAAKMNEVKGGHLEQVSGGETDQMTICSKFVYSKGDCISQNCTRTEYCSAYKKLPD